jgi:uncharacterized membrane protein YeaQ/YmgE (transglycosylase-associated protein family)
LLQFIGAVDLPTFAWFLVVGIVVSLILRFLCKVRLPGGYIVELVAAWLGARIGSRLFGYWSVDLKGLFLVPAILGAIAAIYLFHYYAEVHKQK